MAVAEKNPSTQKASKPTPLPVLSILGAVYVIACLALLFAGLPLAWEQVGFTATTFSAVALRGLVTIVGFIFLTWLGLRLLGSNPTPGAKAGTFMALVLLLVWLILSRWIGGILYGWTFDGFLSGLGLNVGLGLFALCSLLLLFWFVRRMFRPTFSKRLVRMEEQGWFTLKAYKPGQGLRVRRGTMLGIMILAGAGIWVLVSRGVASGDWSIDVPFTAEAVVTESGSGPYLEKGITPELKKQLGDLEAQKAAEKKRSKNPGDAKAPAPQKMAPIIVDRRELRGLNDRLAPGSSRQITDPGYFAEYGRQGLDEQYLFEKNQIVPKKQFEEAIEAIKKIERDRDPDFKTNAEQREREIEQKARKAAPPTREIKADIQYANVMILPDLQFTLPLLLIGITIWFAWRVINLPVFADFLIATEAEVNKVSWTTKSRLYQDTIVVLTTLILMAAFFYIVDFAWYKILSSRPIGVLKIPEDTDKKKYDSNLKW